VGHLLGMLRGGPLQRRWRECQRGCGREHLGAAAALMRARLVGQLEYSAADRLAIGGQWGPERRGREQPYIRTAAIRADVPQIAPRDLAAELSSDDLLHVTVSRHVGYVQGCRADRTIAGLLRGILQALPERQTARSLVQLRVAAQLHVEPWTWL